jgi:hypothetical protein
MKFSKVILAMLLIPTMVACVSTPQAKNEPTAVVEPTPGEALQDDAAEYARQFGVSQEEALRRLRVQNEIGGLGAALQRDEAETFAGLWIQHEPNFGVVAAFTRDGEQTIQPYLEGKSYAGLVEVKTFPYSLRELESAQQRAIRISEELGIPITSFISVQENRVIIVVGNPEMFQEEIRSAGRELPELVEVVAIDPDRLTDTLRGGIETYPRSGGGMIYFPRQAPTNAYTEALLEGTLILDPNGCLRVESEGGDALGDDSPLVLWRHDFALQVEDDVIEILNGEGQVVGRVGEAIRMGGGETSAKAVPGLPIEACPGPYWALGEFKNLAAQAIPDIFVNTVQVDGLFLPAFFLYQSKLAPEEDILSGTLTLDEDRCFRIGGYTLLWPPDVWSREEPGPLRFVRVDGETETTFAVLGEEVHLPGAERTPDDYRFFENKVQCEGPYWGVATIEAAK